MTPRGDRADLTSAEPVPARWHEALAFALTGERLDLGLQEVPSVDELAAALAARGMSPDNQHHVVPDDLMRNISYARFVSLERRLRAELGADGLVSVRPSGRRPDAADRRLLADRPPHWG